MKIYKILIAAGVASLIVLSLGGCAAEKQKDFVSISLADGASSADGAGVTVNEDVVTITQPGRYEVKGSLTDGQLVVNSSGEAELIFDGVNVNNSTGPAIYALSGDIRLKLSEGSENSFSDGEKYALVDSDGEPDAAFFCKDSLVIEGSGSLQVVGNYADAIADKDDLTIEGGKLTLTAMGYGLKGKDSLTLNGGELVINSEGNGIGSSKGNVVINDGAANINAAGKGIKGETDLEINGGSLNITSTDDAIHSNANTTINSGSFNITTEDDAVHAEEELVINDCNIQIASCKEGLEGHTVTVNGGDINLKSTDDGINAAAPSTTDETAEEFAPHEKGDRQMPEGGEMPRDMQAPPDMPRGDFTGGEGATGEGVPPGMPQSVQTSPDMPPANLSEGEGAAEPGDMQQGKGFRQLTDGTNADGNVNFHGGGMGGGMMDKDESCLITINDGDITIDSSGDGIDSNGNIVLNGGNISVYGPENSGNAALDCGGEIIYNGGEVIAFGMGGMEEAPSADNSQGYSIMYNGETSQANTIFAIYNSTTGELLREVTSPKKFGCVVYGSEKISENDSLEIRINGETAKTADITGKSITVGEVVREGGGMHMGGRRNRGFGGMNTEETTAGQQTESRTLA